MKKLKFVLISLFLRCNFFLGLGPHKICFFTLHIPFISSSCDFVICLYNPSSKKRSDYLARACDIILQYRSPETVCGIAHHIGREGEGTIILSLAQLKTIKVDMFATVFIGNSQTKIINGKMVTPRGYGDV